jgi:molecular chaperone GrpE
VAHHAESADAATLLDGVQLVEKKLLQVLESSGLEPLDPAGQIFDPATMEALATVAVDKREEDDRVADVFQRGYRFKGQLIRPARVRVKQYEA